MTRLVLHPQIPSHEWQRRTAADRPLEEALLDPVWRIARLYTFYNKATKRFEPFRPKPEQQVIIWALFVLGRKNIIIPKARQIGFSVLFAIIGTDITLFNPGAKSALVDKSKVAGMKKMSDIVRVAWERLPACVRSNYSDPVLNASEFGAKLEGAEDDGWSRFRVEDSGRGDALVFLWISEWGTIQFEEPARSKEILTGGMEAAGGNIRVIETTWKGGEGGDVWPFVEQALKKADSEKTADDWFLYFFPWWVEQRYRKIGDVAAIPQATARYLDDMEREISAASGRAFRFDDGQRVWYADKRAELGLFVLREYPTVLRECWMAPVDGAIYAEAYAEALADGRVRAGCYNPEFPVYTAWDLGGPENMVVWYFQIYDGRVWWIDCDIRLWLTTRGRVAHMKGKGYTFAKHLIPHDAGQMQKGALTYEHELIAAGLEDIVVVERTRDEWLGIDRVRQLFPHFVFDSALPEAVTRNIKQYHVHPKTGKLVHDQTSHVCDGLRTMAEGHIAGHINLDCIGMTNHDHLLFFDKPGVDHLAARAVSWAARLKRGVIEHAIFQRKDDDGAWLRMWEDPIPGQRYVLTLSAPVTTAAEGWAAAVWRAHMEPGKAANPVMSAALVPGLRMDHDRVSEWVAAMSVLYGRALVIPVITGAEGLVDMLAADGCQIWLREEPLSNQPGEGRRNRKPGFKITDASEEQVMAALAARIRELAIDCGAPEVAAQCAQVLRLSPEVLPAPAAGHGMAWVRCAALAAFGIGSATTCAVASAAPVTAGGYVGGYVGGEG